MISITYTYCGRSVYTDSKSLCCTPETGHMAVTAQFKKNMLSIVGQVLCCLSNGEES